MRNMYEANKYGWRQISNYRCEYPMCGSRIFFPAGVGVRGIIVFAQSRGPRPIFGKLLCEFCQKKYVMSLIYRNSSS